MIFENRKKEKEKFQNNTRGMYFCWLKRAQKRKQIMREEHRKFSLEQ